MLADLFRKPELEEAVKRKSALLEREKARAKNAKERLRVSGERIRIVRTKNHILMAMEERSDPRRPDVRRDLEALDKELAEPHNPDLERQLEGLDRELADLPCSDLKRRLEALDREAADLHNPGIRPREHDHFLLSDVSEGAPTFNGTDIPVQYMFDYLEHTRNIYDFLQDFPEVKILNAINAMRDHVRAELPEHIRCDRERDNGEPVFWGSGTSMRDLFEQLADGRTVDQYLASSSSPSREQVIRTLEMAGLLMEAMAYENAIG